MTHTEKIIYLMKSGGKFHSRDLFKATTWDFRKYASNAKKVLEVEGYTWHTAPAGKGMNYYWVTKEPVLVKNYKLF